MNSEKSTMYILRKSKGLTQQEMSEILGISKQKYARFENKVFKSKDSVEILMKFADFFGVTTDYLLNRSSEAEDEIHRILRRMDKGQIDWILCTAKTLEAKSDK